MVAFDRSALDAILQRQLQRHGDDAGGRRRPDTRQGRLEALPDDQGGDGGKSLLQEQ